MIPYSENVPDRLIIFAQYPVRDKVNPLIFPVNDIVDDLKELYPDADQGNCFNMKWRCTDV